MNYYYPQMPQNSINWANSEQEAWQFLMLPNSAVTICNRNLQEVYIKKTDAAGYATMDTYVRKETAQPEIPKFLTAGDLKGIEDRITAIEGRLNHESANEPDADHAAIPAV